MKLRIVIAFVVCVVPFLTASAQQKSIIRGRVVYADTGRPLRRAEVSLVTQHSEDWIGNSITDRSGEFVFTDVGAGKYFVVVSAPDIVSPQLLLGSNESLSVKIALGQIEDGFSEVTVDGRSSVKTEIRASRGGAITGRILTESDEPIAKAQITLFQVENGKPRVSNFTELYYYDQKRRLETDSRGIYRIAGLPTGEYIVRASESYEKGNPEDAPDGNYRDGSMMVAFHPKALRIQDATSVKLQQGSEATDIDIRLPDRIAHRVAGIVVVRGRPAQSARIQLTSDEAGVLAYSSSLRQMYTDIRGNWEIRGVPDGTYNLVIGGMGRQVNLGPEGYVTVKPLRRRLVVAGGDLLNLNFELTEGATVNGVVSFESGTKSPERLWVELVSSETPDGPVVETNYVNNNGTFSLSGLPSGLFHLRLTGLRTDTYVKSITLSEKDLVRNPLKIEEGKLVDGVRIVLSSDLVTLTGRAVEKDGRSKPLINAAVLLAPIEVERRRVSKSFIAARSDKDGRFVVKAPPGEYFVFVFDRDRKDVPTEAFLIKNSSTFQKVTVQRGDEKIVEVVGP